MEKEGEEGRTTEREREGGKRDRGRPYSQHRRMGWRSGLSPIINC